MKTLNIALIALISICVTMTLSSCSDDPATTPPVIDPPSDYDPVRNVRSLFLNDIHSQVFMDSLNTPRLTDTNVTISFWIKIDELPVDQYRLYEIMKITKPYDVVITGHHEIFYAHVRVSPSDTVLNIGEPGNRAAFSVNPKLKQWVHFTWVLNSTEEFSSLWVDGQLHSTISSKDRPTNSWFTWSNYRQYLTNKWMNPYKMLMIGRVYGADNSSQSIIGKMCGLSIYNRALSANEIASMWTRKPQPQTSDFTGLVGLWDFNGTFKDCTGSEYVGKDNRASFSEDVPDQLR